jgi:hypothetical protein
VVPDAATVVVKGLAPGGKSTFDVSGSPAWPTITYAGVVPLAGTVEVKPLAPAGNV